MNRAGVTRVAIADIDQMNSNIGADELHVVDLRDQRRQIGQKPRAFTYFYYLSMGTKGS